MPGPYDDLTIEDVLDDPMILALRRADHVEPNAFEALLRSSARALRTGGLTVRSPGGGADALLPDGVPESRRAECERFTPAHICRRILDGLRPHEHGRGVSREW